MWVRAVRLWTVFSVGVMVAGAVGARAAGAQVAPRPVAVRNECAGVYRMTAKVSDVASLAYTLHLVEDAPGKRAGVAELHVERKGEVDADRQNGRDFGSVATVYLQKSPRVVHKGRWESGGGGKFSMTLETIGARKDVARFSGSVLNNVLTMTTENRGMYGEGVAFRMERGLLTQTNANPFERSLRADGGGDATPTGPLTARDVAGTYSFTARREVGGAEVEIEYVLTLRDTGEAVMTARRKEKPGRDAATGSAFGSLATVYLQEREEVSHRGKWEFKGDRVTMELVTIGNRADKAKFSGVAKRGAVELRSENTGMYGSFPFAMTRKTYEDLKD